MENIAEYVSGEFYKRELPCILSLLAKIEVESIEAIVVDGYVYLDDEGGLGLGGHLYHHLDAKIPVIGVAKAEFLSIDKQKTALVRGQSARPLYVTAAGMPLKDATAKIRSMHGEFRIPTLLRDLDKLTKLAKFIRPIL